MVAQNPVHTYKALLWDYDALLETSDQECCYSLSEREVAIILASVDYIGWKTRYQPTETEIDQSLILRWQGNLARKLMSGCCPDDGLLHRFTADGTYETSSDGGVTWTPDPEHDPRNQVTYYPPLPGEDGNDKKCLAATSGQEYVKQNLIDSLNDGMAYSEVYAVAVAIIGILGVTGIGVIIAAIGAAIMLAGVLVVQAAFTSEVWKAYKCILYCNSEPDGSFTTSEWAQVKSDITTQFTGVVNTILWNWVNSVGAIGLTNAGRSGFADSGDCGTCGCGECNLALWDQVYLGTVIGTGTDYIEMQAANVAGAHGNWRVSLGTASSDLCCCFLNFVYPGDPPSGHYEKFYICGEEITTNPEDGFHVGFPVAGTSVWVLAVDATESFTVRFYFGGCS